MKIIVIVMLNCPRPRHLHKFSLFLILSMVNLLHSSSISTLTLGPILKQPLELQNLKATSQRDGKSIISHPTVYRCGEIGKDSVVNFVNRNYPGNDVEGGDCSFRLVIGSPHICQVRIDFVDTEMLLPVKGDCLSQMFEIEGPIWPIGIPPLCGTNNDNHFYLHLESWSANTSWVDFRVATIFSGKPYRFGVWLTQIDCSNFNVLKAPEGCTQYFLGEKGSFKTFNYESLQQMNGHNYRICIRPGKGVCGVKYESNVGDFNIRKSILAPREIQMKSGVGSSICGLDYLLIPGGRPNLNKIVNVNVNRPNLNRVSRLLFRRRPTRPSLIIIQTGPSPTQKPKPNVIPITTTTPKVVTKKKVQRVRRKKIWSWDRFCGGVLAPNGGMEVARPIFARVRSNLITLQVRTATSFERKNIRRNNNLNLPQGFRISYAQLRDCNHDNDTVDLANQPSIMQLIQNIHLNNHDSDPPLLRDQEQGELEEEHTNNGQSVENSTASTQGNDNLWDYLENEGDDDEEEEDEDYDF